MTLFAVLDAAPLGSMSVLVADLRRPARPVGMTVLAVLVADLRRLARLWASP